MFDTTLLEQNSLNSSVGNQLPISNNLTASGINTSATDPFLSSTSHHELSLSSGFDLDYYINQNLDAAKANNSDAFDSTSVSTNTAVDALSTEAKDPLTGFSANDSLASNTASNAASSSTPWFTGTLRAEHFTLQSGSNYIISGNGNVDFGRGFRDQINLSGIYSNSVRFNLASSTGGGLLFNPGNGTRLFDAMTLSNGNQILFEGIDSIRFANGTVNLSTRPNDPRFNSQWNLHMMGVQNAWRFTKGSTGVLIGVQDSGLGVNSNGIIHPDLPTTTVFPNNYQDDFRRSNESHGTGVQGIIAAKSDNGIGMSGINWNSRVFNIDVLDGGLNENDQDLAQAALNMINEANRNGQRLVINMSLGIPGSFGWTGNNRAFQQVVASNPNVLFVIAAGNSGHLGRAGIADPAVLAQQYGNVIAVGASWGTRDRNGFARTPGQRIQYNGQNGWGSQYGPGLTLMGPSEVISTMALRSQFGTQFDYYTSGNRFNGTSAAAPNVAGVASLVWSANRNLSAAQIKTILSQTASDLGARGYDYLYGHGFVNADAAVRRAMALRYSASSTSFSSSGGNFNGSMSSANGIAQDDGSYLASNSASANLDRSATQAIDQTELVRGVVKFLGNLASSRSIIDEPETMANKTTEVYEDSFEAESIAPKDAANSSAILTALELNKATKVQDDADSASYDFLTGMTSISKLAGLSSELSDVLAPGFSV